ncbi:hypothetical protein IID19_01240, partial [Patescibacteria group bacterium]|nr:hypothetical protein [Patescibacteria group bacterium]
MHRITYVSLFIGAVVLIFAPAAQAAVVTADSLHVQGVSFLTGPIVNPMGAVTIADNLDVHGAIFRKFGAVKIGDDLDVHGAIFRSFGPVKIGDGILQLGGEQVTFSGNVNANKGLDVIGTLNVSGATMLSSLGTGLLHADANGLLSSSGILGSDFAAGAIGLNKLASGTSGQLIVGNASGVPTYVSASGDVLISNLGVNTIQPNSVALTTDTTGNYVASLANGTGITGGAAGSEGGTLTIGVDEANAFTWTSLHIFSSVDINGGAIDGTTIGSASASTGAFTTLNSSSLFTGTLGATLSGAVVSLNNDSNFAVNINTGTSNAALALGGGMGTVAINSSDWDIDVTGAFTDGAVDSSPVGASTASTGAFTTLSASSLFTGTLGATISGAAISLNNASNSAVNINTGTSTGTLTLGGGSGSVIINSDDWDITALGVITGVAFNANDTGNTLTNVDNADLTADTIDFDSIANSATIDEATSFTGAAGNTLTIARTLTNNTSENALLVTTTASDTSGTTTAQYGLYLDNVSTGTQAADALLVLDNSDGAI